MAQKVVNSDENFYQRLDRETLGQSPFSCTHLVILLIIIFFGLYGGAWYFTRGVHWFSLGSQKSRLEQSVRILLSRIQDNLINQSSQTITVSISEKEFNDVVKNTERIEGARLRKLQVDLTSTNVVISGLYTQLVAVPFTMWYDPMVENGALVWQLEKTAVGRVSLPAFINKQLDRLIQPTLKSIIQPFKNVEIKEVSLSDEAMTITSTAR